MLFRSVPDALVSDISVGMQQRVEILKMLYRDNEILIFDEPTAVLTPQEIDELMEIMRGFKKEGKSILFITHKLNEIMAVADRCTVLRKGKYMGTVDIKDTTGTTNIICGKSNACTNCTYSSIPIAEKAIINSPVRNLFHRCSLIRLLLSS